MTASQGPIEAEVNAMVHALRVERPTSVGLLGRAFAIVVPCGGRASAPMAGGDSMLGGAGGEPSSAKIREDNGAMFNIVLDG